MQNIGQTRKKMKFDLLDDDEDQDIDFFTHRGKKLEDIDDFKDKISNDSGDDYEDRDMKKGVLGEEMVKALNFGGGEEEMYDENSKKTREERH